MAKIMIGLAGNPRDVQGAPKQPETSSLEELQGNTHDQTMVKLSGDSIAAAAAANEDVKKEVFFPASSKPARNLPPKPLHRQSTPDAGPPFLLHQYFSTRRLPKKLDPMESSAAPKSTPLSHFTDPSPMGLSMRKVDLQPRPVEKSVPPTLSIESNPTSPSKTPPGTKRWKPSLTYQDQLSGKENLEDLSKFWKLRFNSQKKSQNETARSSSELDNNNEPGGRQRRLSTYEERKLINNMSRKLNEVNLPTGMPLNEDRSRKQLKRKFRRHTETF